MSHPTWVRGLKYKTDFSKRRSVIVAPHMGAWIEIHHMPNRRLSHQSHPTWVRGLKF